MSTRHASIRLYNPITQKRRTLHFTAWYADARDGFNHFAECDEWGYDSRVKIHYINRTWERQEFDSVIEKCADKIKDFWQKTAKRNRREAKREAKRIAKENARLAKLEANGIVKVYNRQH